MKYLIEQRTQSGDWSGDLSFTLLAHVSKVKLVLNNIVDTHTDTSALAFIGGAKTSLSTSIVTVPLPEPSSIILLGMGALLFVFGWKRK